MNINVPSAPVSATSSSALSSRPGGDAKALQERLHELLTRLSDTTDCLKQWPDSEGDDAQVHYDATSRLMDSIQDIIQAIQRVEGVVKGDEILYETLQNCQVPVDLLELLDHGGGMNPECFARGLLREALSQLVGLRRRKVALEMLGTAIQNGLNKRDVTQQQEQDSDESKGRAGVKRGRDDSDSQHNDKSENQDSEPPAKRAKGKKK